MDWVKTAKAGDKIVCLETWHDNPNRKGTRDEVGPIAGKVYTIREIGYLHPEHPDEIALRLVEIVNPVRVYHFFSGLAPQISEACFRTKRFRPVDQRPTSITIFTDMLRTKQDELA